MDTPATTKVVEFKKTLSSLIMREELDLPSSVSVEAFKNAAIIAVQDNPDIFKCDNTSIFKSIRQLATAGLVPDGREAALVPFSTKVDNQYVKKCQAMPMVHGLIKMVRKSGNVTGVRAHIVYDNEIKQGKFTYIQGDDEKLVHEPILFGDRGDPVAAYAIVSYKDGTIEREFMTSDEINTVRKSSASQKKYASGQRPTVSEEPLGIWKDWWTEMWKKTVIRRLCKRLDMSSEDMRRLMIDEDTPAMKDVTPKEDTRPTPHDMLSGKASTAEEDVIEEGDEAIDMEALPVDDAFPGSDAFTQGQKDFRKGLLLENCPYDKPQDKIDWKGGYVGAQKADEPGDEGDKQ